MNGPLFSNWSSLLLSFGPFYLLWCLKSLYLCYIFVLATFVDFLICDGISLISTHGLPLLLLVTYVLSNMSFFIPFCDIDSSCNYKWFYFAGAIPLWLCPWWPIFDVSYWSIRYESLIVDAFPFRELMTFSKHSCQFMLSYVRGGYVSSTKISALLDMAILLYGSFYLCLFYVW